MMDKELLDVMRLLLQEELAPLKEQMTGLDGRVMGLQEQVTGLQTQVTGLQEQVTGLQTQVTGLQTQVTGLQEQVTGLDGRVTGLQLTIENDIRPSIKLVAEGHAALAEKLSCIDDFKVELDEIKGSMVAIEAVVVKNKVNIIDLQRAKEN